MMRSLLIVIVFIHGLIHITGFAKAFYNLPQQQISGTISKTAGIAWLTTGLLLINAGILLAFRKQEWWIPASIGLVASQVLVFSNWADAGYGTIANIILLVAVIVSVGQQQFEQHFYSDVAANISAHPPQNTQVVTEQDLQHLPRPVQAYLRYAGVVNKPKVSNMRLVFEGRMRSKEKGWFPFTSVQYNFYDRPTRLFFMKGRMFGITVPGYHAYKNGVATMNIRLAGILPLISKKGNELNKAETVTFFNDVCMFAPAVLTDPHIAWMPIDDRAAKAFFTNNGITIAATLFFNEKNQLVNFISEDRYDISDMQQHSFSTPAKDYRTINGYQLTTYGEAVWHYAAGPFTYGEFRLREIAYNVDRVIK